MIKVEILMSYKTKKRHFLPNSRNERFKVQTVYQRRRLQSFVLLTFCDGRSCWSKHSHGNRSKLDINLYVGRNLSVVCLKQEVRGRVMQGNCTSTFWIKYSASKVIRVNDV